MGFNRSQALNSIPEQTSPRYLRNFLTFPSDIKILNVEGMFLDEFSPRFDMVSHQHAKNLFGGGGIFQSHLQQQSSGGIHRRFKQFIRIHFSQSFEPRIRQSFGTQFAQCRDKFSKADQATESVVPVNLIGIYLFGILRRGRNELSVAAQNSAGRLGPPSRMIVEYQP